MPHNLETPPTLIIQPITNPGAGNEISFTVPANVIYHLIAISYTQTTNPGGTDRQVQFTFTSASDLFFRLVTGNKTAGGVVQLVVWDNAATVFSSSVHITHHNTIPNNIFLFPTQVIASVTASKDAADTFTNIFFLLHQFLTPLTS